MKSNRVKSQHPYSTWWNSRDECIGTFLNNYQELHKICLKLESAIDRNVVATMKNADIYMEAMHNAPTPTVHCAQGSYLIQCQVMIPLRVIQ